jgi:hypothetical protein
MLLRSIGRILTSVLQIFDVRRGAHQKQLTAS